MTQQVCKWGKAAFPVLLLFIVVSSCTKDSGHQRSPADYSNVPRKEAPAVMVGNWLHTEVSSSNVEYNGHSVPAYLFGATFHIEADGKGWQAITSTVNTYTSSHKQDVNSDVSYEIDVDGESMLFKFYTIQGEVWENDHFSHPLEASKCYPATYGVSECTLGEDSRGIYFEVNDDGTRYYKQ